MRAAALLLAMTLALGAAGGALAQSAGSLLPAIPKATGAPHPEGNRWWRENHPDLLRHDRDLTVHEGQREVTASLKGCFDCHAATDDDGSPATYSSDKHFCRVCHDYAAVRVDCFSCHRSTPEGVDEAAEPEEQALDAAAFDPGAILAYLGRFGTGRAAAARAEEGR